MKKFEITVMVLAALMGLAACSQSGPHYPPKQVRTLTVLDSPPHYPEFLGIDFDALECDAKALPAPAGLHHIVLDGYLKGAEKARAMGLKKGDTVMVALWSGEGHDELVALAPAARASAAR